MSDRRSRYARATAVTWTDATGDDLVLWELRDIPSTPAVYAHTLVDGERLDHLAYRYYRDATKFWRITDGADSPRHQIPVVIGDVPQHGAI